MQAQQLMAQRAGAENPGPGEEAERPRAQFPAGLPGSSESPVLEGAASASWIAAEVTSNMTAT